MWEIGHAEPCAAAGTVLNELEAGPPATMRLAGFIALSGPPGADSAALVTQLRGLGVRTVMVTGDAPATAAIVAHAVGLDGAVCPPGPIPEGVRT